MSKKQPVRHIRISDDLWNQLGEIATELSYDNDQRGGRSTLIREMVSAAVAKWRHSPYVCMSSKNFIFLAHTGDVFYRHYQVLRLNSRREKLPWSLEMKPEKRAYFEAQCPRDANRDDWIRSRWLLNHFAVWEGKGDKNKLLRSEVDRNGVTAKSVNTPVNAKEGRFLTRELFVSLADYVQWHSPKQSDYDRADIPLDIPTRDLSITLLIDQEIYRRSSLGSTSSSPAWAEIAMPALEFRNRESARFKDNSVAASYNENPLSQRYGRSSDEDKDVEAVKELFHSFAERGIRLAQPSEYAHDGSPIATREARRKTEELLRLPENFLYLQCEWKSPHHGLEICVRFEKPVKGC